METIMESKHSNETSISTMQIKTQSAPLVLPTPRGSVSIAPDLTVHLSAPCYLASLKDNNAPPFRKPAPEARPKLLIGTIMTEAEAVEMVAAAAEVDGLKNFLGTFLVNKKVTENYSLSEKMFLTSLVAETMDYAAQCSLSAAQLACLVTVYLNCHLYFKWYYWLTPIALWNYFYEILIRHTIEDSPDGEEVFEPEESYDILTHFHAIYMNNLPLIHLRTFGCYRLKFQWPIRPK